MAYLGNEQLKSSEIRKSTPVTASGGESTHSLGFTAPSAQAVMFYINGVKQNTDTYSVSGTTLTLAGGATLATGDVVQAIGINDIGTSITVAPNSIGTNELAATGTPTSSKYLNGSMVWSQVTVGALTAANSFFKNWTTVSSSQVSTIAASENAAIIGPISVSGASTVWEIAGELNILQELNMASKILVDELAPQSHATDVTITTGKKIAGANTQYKVTGGASGQVLTNDGSDGLSWSAAGSTVKRACLVDQKTAGTDGGTFTSGSWQQRDLQTAYYDDITITFGTNTFILPAGTFYIDWSCPAFAVENHQTRLYNITSAGVVQAGSAAQCKLSTAWAATRSEGSTKITVGTSTTFKIEHRCSSTFATEGLGRKCNFGEPEVYTIVNIMQIA